MYFPKFIEPEYDGVVIKIPSFFIELNKIEPNIDLFLKCLEECKYSVMLPDVVNSKHEISNRKEKQNTLLKEKQRDEERKIQHQEYIRKRTSLEILDVVWKTESVKSEHGWMEPIRYCKDGDDNWEYLDYMDESKKGGTTQKLIDSVNDTIEKMSDTEFNSLLVYNFIMASVKLKMNTTIPDFVKISRRPFDVVNLFPIVRIQIPHVRVYKNEKEYFEISPRIQSGSITVPAPRKSMNNISLDGYTLEGSKLIKNK